MPDLVKEHAKAAEASKSADRLATAQATLAGAQKSLVPAAEARQREIADLFDLIKQEAGQTMAEKVDDRRTGQQRETAELAQTQGLTQNVLGEAGKQLEARQRRELAASVDQPEAAKADLGRRHQKQRDDLAALIDRTTKALERNTSEMRNRQDDEVKRIAGAVRASNPDHALREAADAQQRELRQEGNTARRLLGAVRTESQSIVNRLSPEQTQKLRERIGSTADVLDDAAIQRVAQAARGKERDQQIDAMKGQLGEELNNRRVEEELKTAADKANVFIAGDRIRDGLGRKLTDGVIARQREDRKWEIVKAFEVKSGQTESLVSDIRMDKSQELRNLAADLARQELADEVRLAQRTFASEAERRTALEQLDAERRALVGEAAIQHEREDSALIDALPKPERDARMEELTRQKEAALRDPEVQTTAGQLERTQERLSQQRVFIDGEELDQDVDELRQRVEIVAVVASDAAVAEEAERLKERQNELEAMAAAVADELDKWEKP